MLKRRTNRRYRIIIWRRCKAKIQDCRNNVSGKILHFVEVMEGNIKLQDKVNLTVDNLRRDAIKKIILPLIYYMKL